MNLKHILIAAFVASLLQAGNQAIAAPLNGVSRLKSEIPLSPGSTHRPRLIAPALQGKRTVPPLAFVKFCQRDKANCAVRLGHLPTRNGLVIATPGVLSDLISTNALVNKSITPRPDKPGRDVWKLDVSAGDCDDFVLAKRARLLDLGWPSSGLSIAVVRTRQGTGHAVLVARTDAGDFVLDNLRGEIHTRDKSPYRFVSMQDGTRRLGWLAL